MAARQSGSRAKVEGGVECPASHDVWLQGCQGRRRRDATEQMDGTPESAPACTTGYAVQWTVSMDRTVCPALGRAAPPARRGMESHTHRACDLPLAQPP